ncbi:MAG: type transport system ATP-binding protein, partial [Actinomycetota bacterium]|nr:type transport system ATP-binding protein [Actinomycetota bacterium]
MTTPPAIIVTSVTKRFTLRHGRTIKEMTVRLLRRQQLRNVFCALEDVSLTVGTGQSVALMGLNGSGKSTLLKLISGVMTPDRGSVLAFERIAGLIDVGAGLHPDLTGRENIYLNAAILGMTEDDTEERFDSIVDFAEIRQFLDTEVKFYSSGMFMRLAFSVAVHTEPDIFLIDEVLAVGDPPVRRKCRQRIRQLREEGRTLVVVAHDMGLLKEVCDRGVVLDRGKVVHDGDIDSAIEFFDTADDLVEQKGRGRLPGMHVVDAKHIERRPRQPGRTSAPEK